MQTDLFRKMGMDQTDTEVLSLYYVEGWTMPMIADLFEVHKSAIFERIQRCLKLLQNNGLSIPMPKRKRLRQVANLGSMQEHDPDAVDSMIYTRGRGLIIENWKRE